MTNQYIKDGDENGRAQVVQAMAEKLNLKLYESNFAGNLQLLRKIQVIVNGKSIKYRVDWSMGNLNLL